jgi:hypothetical protein
MKSDCWHRCRLWWIEYWWFSKCIFS